MDNKNSKIITIIAIIGIILVVAIIGYYFLIYLPQKEEDEKNAIINAYNGCVEEKTSLSMQQYFNPKECMGECVTTLRDSFKVDAERVCIQKFPH